MESVDAAMPHTEEDTVAPIRGGPGDTIGAGVLVYAVVRIAVGGLAGYINPEICL